MLYLYFQGLLWLFPVITVHCQSVVSPAAAVKPCITPSGVRGQCLPYQQCSNLTQWREHHNLQTRTDVEKMVCTGTQPELLSICCNRTKNYFSETSLQTKQLNSVGLELLHSQRCVGPSASRIAGGTNAVFREYPFMALLRYDAPGHPFRCGGSLISQRYVLTAAHCLLPQLLSVRLGEQDLSTTLDCVTIGRRKICNPPVQDIGIEQKLSHPSYNQPKYAHDVGLIRLERDVGFEAHIRPICLPLMPISIDVTTPTEYLVAGWGRTENAYHSDVLQTAVLPHRERTVCAEVFPQVTISYDHICAGGEQQIDTCKGDSGGPLFAIAPYNRSEYGEQYRYVQYGIVSFGLIFCGGNNTKAAAYSNVAQHMSWILDNMLP